MRLELARRLCASILLRFLFQLVVVSASGVTSRRNSAVLTVQAASLGKRTSEDMCGTDVAKDRGSSVPTVTCVRKRSRTCIDTLGPNIEECASFSSTSLPIDSFTHEKINRYGNVLHANELPSNVRDTEKETYFENRAINNVISSNPIAKRIRHLV